MILNLVPCCLVDLNARTFVRRLISADDSGQPSGPVAYIITILISIVVTMLAAISHPLMCGWDLAGVVTLLRLAVAAGGALLLFDLCRLPAASGLGFSPSVLRQ